MLRATDAWTDRVVARWAYAVFGLAIVAVVVVMISRHDQNHRRITNVVSATVTKTNPQLHSTLGPVTVNKQAATELAAQLNSLPKPYSGGGCPADTGSTYDVRFTTSSGSTTVVVIDATGCSDVTLNAANWNRSDRNGVVRAVLTQELARS